MFHQEASALPSYETLLPGLSQMAGLLSARECEWKQLLG